VHVIDWVRWNFGEFARVAADAGIAYADRAAPGESRAPDAEDFCSVMAELASGARVAFTVSRVARGITEQSLECYGSTGALSYRMDRVGPRWFRGELKATRERGGELAMVRAATGLPKTAGEGDQLEVTGKATIGPLVKRFLTAIRTGQPASPSLEDGVRAQEILDAVLESLDARRWVEVHRAG